MENKVLQCQGKVRILHFALGKLKENTISFIVLALFMTKDSDADVPHLHGLVQLTDS